MAENERKTWTVELFRGFAISDAFFSERRDFVKTNAFFFQDKGGGDPIAPGYKKFIEQYNWFHLVSTLADHQFLKLESVLDQNIVDVLSYLSYMNAKANADKAQRDYLDKINAHRRWH